jgi:hypothetical protein
VSAVFSKAIYLLTKEGDLFWITREDAPMHTRAVTVPSPLPNLMAGSPFRVERTRLIVGDSFAFELDNPSLWQTYLIDSRDAIEISKLAARTRSFFSNLDTSQAKGFGTFIPLILSSSRNESNPTLAKFADPILLFAQPIVLRLVHACLRRDNSLISENVNALIGLGSGLTPSGDDFIGGLLFALHILRNTYPSSSWLQFPVERYSAKTNLISFNLLSDLTQGYAMEPLHETAYRLLSEEPFERIYPFVIQLIHVGNSTGWDLLAGLLTGFLSACQDENKSLNFHRSQSGSTERNGYGHQTKNRESQRRSGASVDHRRTCSRRYRSSG